MKKTMVRFVSLALFLELTLSAQAGDAFPEVIALPDEWGPEGIEIGRGTDFYAGARHLSVFAGAIYKGDLRTGAGDILVPPQAGRAALGLKLDQRSNYLFVAGGPTGAGFVYDGTTGEDLAQFQFAPPPATFVNDVVVTKEAAYFTDSLRPVIYRVPLWPGGRLPDPPVFTEVPLGGDFEFGPGFNSNGIAATQNGDALIIVRSGAGLLYRVNPESGVAILIDLGGALVTSGDGLLLEGRTLYVCRNSLNRIAVVELNTSLTAGTYVEDILSPDFKIPTTIASLGGFIYAVNARFNLGNPPPPGTEFDIVKVSQ
jgi:hypothetical protein